MSNLPIGIPGDLLVERWPPQSAFKDLRQSVQLTDGKVRCLRVAVCDESGEVRTRFLQCERAHFFVEFEVLQDIAVPAAGVALLTQAGVVIHGKNTFQHASPVPNMMRAGSILRCHHCIELRVATQEYDFVLGLAGTDLESYDGYVNGHLSHEEFSKRNWEHCRVMNAGSLVVGYAAGGKLSHHGMADLPGYARLQVTEGGVGSADVVTEVAQDPMPPVFHVTHWKAGSQWIYRILRQCALERIIEPRPSQAQVLHYPIQRASVYPTVYITREDLVRVAPPDSKRFVVIRDLRDTLVSAWFSFKYSHALVDDDMVALRKKLVELDQEAGLLLLLDNFLLRCAKIQLSWIEAGEPILKYEELLEDDLGLLERTLIGECGLPIRPEDLRKAILDSRFEPITQGRKRGCEEILAHERKGVAGDWRNHFTERIKSAFKARYGGVLVAAGYEQDLRW
ncbi:MAG TPA: Wzt carbohydrate-binding domain-containing protein [Bryobacteraceae bacterium]|jgi:lipopolysaccharide transport system ATP-binding protein